ncbi:ArsR/SmtB family transcription factor [Streptomyces sp. 7R007]
MGDGMLRLHFTAEDLLSVTFAPQPAPLMELGLAVAALQRRPSGPASARWQHTARRTFPVRARPLFQLIPPTARGPLFLDPLSQGLDAGLDTVLSTPPARVRAELDERIPRVLRPTPWLRRVAAGEPEAWQELERALRAAYDGLLAPSWTHVHAAFDAERAWRTRLLAQHGIRTALAGLAPGGRWEGTTLVLDSPREQDVALTGHGLVLLPSTVWTGHPLVAHHTDAPSVLVYGAAAPLPLLGDRAPDASPLAALLGRTRAAALELLTCERTTTDVARALDISKSSASEHTKALRDARLITTHRAGKAVWHICTPLGLELLATRGV